MLARSISTAMRSPLFRGSEKPLASREAQNFIHSIRNQCANMPKASETFERLIGHIETHPAYHDAPYHNPSHYLCVTRVALLLSNEALSPDDRELLAMTAMLHDFGVAAFVSRKLDKPDGSCTEDASILLAVREGVLDKDMLKPVMQLNRATIFDGPRANKSFTPIEQCLSDADLIQSAGLDNMLLESAILSQETGMDLATVKSMSSFLEMVGPFHACDIAFEGGSMWRNRELHYFEENRLKTTAYLTATQACMKAYSPEG